MPHIKENRGEEEEEGVNEQKMRFKEMFSGLKVVIYQCESTGACVLCVCVVLSLGFARFCLMYVFKVMLC